MAEISGVEGSVLANAVALEASDWSFDRDCAVVDRSNYTTGGEPLNARGQRTGTMSMSGPTSTTSALALKGVDVGSLLTFRFRATPLIWVEMRGRVSKINGTGNKDNGSNWSIQAAQYGAATVSGF